MQCIGYVCPAARVILSHALISKRIPQTAFYRWNEKEVNLYGHCRNSAAHELFLADISNDVVRSARLDARNVFRCEDENK